MDATSTLPQGFTESSLFVVRPEVAIFDEGAPLSDDATATAADLLEIADNCNRRVRETGDECPIVIGHTCDDLPEHEQPEIVGYARDFRVKQFGKSGKKAIYATFRFLKDKFQKAMQYPRRSIELLKKDRVIDPISLLGARTPERDLGLLYYSKQGDKVRYQMDDSHNDLVEEVLAALQQTDTWKAMEQAAKNALAPAPQPDAQQPGEVDPNTEPDAGADDKQQYMAGAPAAGNTFIPGQTDHKDTEAYMADSKTKCAHCGHESDKAVPEQAEKARMASEQERIRFSKMESDLETLRTENDELKRKYRRAERERSLVQLEGEGYQLDRAEELDLVTDMNDETFTKHMARIKKHYQRAPVGHKFIPTANGVEGGRAKFSKEQMHKVVDFATKNGLTYEEALAKAGG